VKWGLCGSFASAVVLTGLFLFQLPHLGSVVNLSMNNIGELLALSGVALFVATAVFII
jgi:hypothetical protein